MSLCPLVFPELLLLRNIFRMASVNISLSTAPLYWATLKGGLSFYEVILWWISLHSQGHCSAASPSFSWWTVKLTFICKKFHFPLDDVKRSTPTGRKGNPNHSPPSATFHPMMMFWCWWSVPFFALYIRLIIVPEQLNFCSVMDYHCAFWQCCFCFFSFSFSSGVFCHWYLAFFITNI